MNLRTVSFASIALSIFLAGCGGGDPPRSGDPAVGSGGLAAPFRGTTLSHPVPSAEIPASPAPFAARFATAPAGFAESGRLRVHPRLRGPRPVRIPGPFDPLPAAASDPRQALFPAASSSPAAPVPLAPATISSFVGLVDDNLTIPPDTMGAAGPNHLVSFLNSEVGFFTKAGVKLNPRTTLLDFWSPLIAANGLPSDVFDPKVLYDQGSGRFIAATFDGRLPAANSWVLLAVSQSSDPTGGWNTWAIPADNTSRTWADFTGLGIDDNTVCITANMFDSTMPIAVFQQGKIWSLPKAQLLQTPRVSTLTRTEFTHPAFALQPAHSFGTGSTEYLVTESGIVVGGRRSLEVLAVAGSPPVLASLGTVDVDAYPDVLALPVAPQDRIDTGDTRILDVVERGGRIYATHTVSDAANAKTEVAWYEILPTAPPTLAQQGRVSNLSRFYYYPSIAVNANRDIALGFSGSSAIEFPGAYYTARMASDANGVTQPVATLKAGAASYFKTNGLPSDPNRWGDYSATSVDPTDDLTFRTLQEYADALNRWGTWWGGFYLSDIAASPPSTDRVRVTWVDHFTNETGFDVQRSPTGASGTFATVPAGAGLPAGTTSFTDAGLTEATRYVYQVQVNIPAGGAILVGPVATVTLPAAPDNLVATKISPLSIRLTWRDNSSGESGYKVERSTPTSVFSVVATLPDNTTSFVDSGLAGSTSYTYRVRAFTAGGDSAPSNVSGASTDPAPPPSSGGGGGCSVVLPLESAHTLPNRSDAASVALLFLPATALSARRLLRPRGRDLASRHSSC